MKKREIKAFILGVILGGVILLGGESLATPLKKKLDVVFNNIKVVVDGKPVKLDSEKQPFIHNGTTYLPIRNVGEALNKKVDWDGESKTVYIGEKPGSIKYLTEELDPYASDRIRVYHLGDPEVLKVAGNEYKTGISLSEYGQISYNLNSLYSNLSFKIGPLNGEVNNEPGKYYIYLDNVLYDEYEIGDNDPVKEININLKGVNQLRIESEYKGYLLTTRNLTRIGIGDPVLD